MSESRKEQKPGLFVPTIDRTRREGGYHHACADAKCPCEPACPYGVLEIRTLTAADKRLLRLVTGSGHGSTATGRLTGDRLDAAEAQAWRTRSPATTARHRARTRTRGGSRAPHRARRWLRVHGQDVPIALRRRARGHGHVLERPPVLPAHALGAAKTRDRRRREPVRSHRHPTNALRHRAWQGGLPGHIGLPGMLIELDRS